MGEIPTADWSWLNAAAERFEGAWKEGRRPRIEDFLAEAEAPRRAAVLAELLRVECELRRQSGEEPKSGGISPTVPGACRGGRRCLRPGDGAASPRSRTRNRPRMSRRPRRAPTYPGPRRPGRAGRDDRLGPARPAPRHRAEPETPVVRPSSPEMPDGHRPLPAPRARSPAAAWGPSSRAATPTWAATWPSRSCSRSTSDDPELVRRFVEEAQIGGQLQHPGIVPVYELGTFGDRRPFFTMKLVKGRTLAALLAGTRPTPRTTCRGSWAIFEQVCQTLAYAHARGVIHRDLKPSNIMVGAFGEVQVMDWGLAKVLPQGGIADEPRPAPTRRPSASSARCGAARMPTRRRPGSRAGHAGLHAAGAGRRRRRARSTSGPTCSGWARSCARSSPASRRTPVRLGEAILRKAMRGETADALRRLDGCGADAELIGPGAGLPGRRARGPAAGCGRGGPADDGLPGGCRSGSRRPSWRGRPRKRGPRRPRRRPRRPSGRGRPRRRGPRRPGGGRGGRGAGPGRAAGAADDRGTGRLGLDRRCARRRRLDVGGAGPDGADGGEVGPGQHGLARGDGAQGPGPGGGGGGPDPWTKALAAAQKARELLEPGSGPRAARPGRGPAGGDHRREGSSRSGCPSRGVRPAAAG